MILSLFTNTFVIDLSVVEEGPDFGKSILWPAVTMVDRIMKNINNRNTKSVIDDIPPSILILFDDLKLIFYYLPGASSISKNSIELPSIF
jgi:hypothetical protein